MIGLYLIAAHLVGDFMLQSRRMSIRKLRNRAVRVQHSVVYALPFVPVAAWQLNDTSIAAWHGLLFIAPLMLLHYLTDSHKFRMTLGSWIEWRASRWIRSLHGMPPNPLPLVPTLMDQTIHLCQIAVLAGVFLT